MSSYGRLRLFTNTVVHGRGAESEAPVYLALDVEPRRIVRTYEDTAPPHDPFATVSAPGTTAGVEERPLGGLGVLLVAAMERSGTPGIRGGSKPRRS